VAASGNFSGPVNISIVNLNGAVISTFGLNKVAPYQTYQISPDVNLKPGIYLVVCRYGNTLTTPVKLIVY
jgi:hypothetical protein